MSRTVCLVTARMASARCPGKALQELLPGEPLLAVLIARMRTSKTVDEVALATSLNPENDAIADLGRSLGLRVFRGDEDDVLKRHIGAAWEYDADTLVRDTGDNPLTDVGTMDALVKLHRQRNADYTYVPGEALLMGILAEEIGFHEVGFGPVTSGPITTFNLSGEELANVFAGMKRLGRRYLEHALQGRNFAFGNMHQLMTDVYEGNKKQLPCGAGVALLAVHKNGGLNLCHRFTGSALPTFGNVRDGVKHEALGDFLSQRLDRSNTGCETCRIRNLCSGGCYHESYARYGDPAHPTYHYCGLMRDWVDFGIEVYSRIMAGNPAFIEQHITPRSAS